MAVIGPVQLLVVGFEQPDFKGEVLDHLQRLREHDLVRVIDILLVYKDPEGVLETRQISDLSAGEAQELGAVAAALIGLGAAAGGDAEGAARLWSAEDGLTEDDLVDVLAEIPPDTAVAIALLEHRWAIPLRESIIAAGGFPILDTWVHPRDLVEVGLLAAAEAEQAL
ncbi:MAG TPA: hypothetical protein VK756_02650 [Solirubrobacteraceae bacterium]|jgi:uncharacterized membrane protein|nr:hypothetical protein [Solirubrobacteraceae bacterium]